MVKKIIVSCIVVIFLVVSSSVSYATNVFQFEGFGPVSRAMGGSGVALDIGTAALMYNPATLALTTDNNRLDVGFDMVIANIRAKNEATGESVKTTKNTRDLGRPYYGPQAGYAKRIYGEGGLGTEYGGSSFLSRTTSGLDSGLENFTRLIVVHFPVGFSYEVTDKLTLGAAMDVVWTGLNLQMLLGVDQVGSLVGSGRASGSLVPVLGGISGLDAAHLSFSQSNDFFSGVYSWGMAGRVGLTYKVAEGTRLGAAYNFKTSLSDLKGQATLTAVSTTLGHIPLRGGIRVRDFQMPASISIGGTHQAGQWTFAADFKRIFWSDAMKDFKIAFEADDGSGNIDINLPQKYKDINILSLGTAYRTGDWILRGGISISEQALRSDQLLAVMPAIPTKHLTAGFTYDISSSSRMNFAYSYALEEKMSNNQLPNTSNAVPIQVSHSQNNFVVSYTHLF